MRKAWNKSDLTCLCDCGKEVLIVKNDVQSSHTLSCGCLQKEMTSQANAKDWSGYITEYGIEILNIDHQNEHGIRVYNCKCPVCNNIFQAIPAKIMNRPTLSCGCIPESSYERITELILKDNNIKYKPQYTFDDCVYKNKLRFDFAVFDNQNNLKCLIENDGEQHFKPIEYFGGQEAFESLKIRDNIKNQYCEDHNISLLRLPYYLSKEEIENEIKKVI